MLLSGLEHHVTLKGLAIKRQASLYWERPAVNKPAWWEEVSLLQKLRSKSDTCASITRRNVGQMVL